MQALILAAGMGSRLGDLTEDYTKSMVKVGGQTMMERLLGQIDKRPEIEKIIIVTGYEGKQLAEYVESFQLSKPVEFIHNDVYDETNNIYSLYLAKDKMMEKDTLLFESDLLFEEAVLDRLLSDTRPNLALVDKFQSWMDGTVVKIDETHHILDFIDKTRFNFDEVDEYYKTVNIYKLSKDFSAKHYIPYLEAYMHSKGKNEYYEAALKIIVDLGIKDLQACVLDDETWYEVDDKQDLDIAETLFAQDRSEKLDLMQARYGGYWRYPGLIDFCYLVNPFYPNEKIVKEIQSNANRLIRDYPSGMKVNTLLASKHFGVDEDYIVIGNGASELIKVIMEDLKGRLGVIVPTFEEYPNRSGHLEIVRYPAHKHGYYYDSEDLIDFYADKNLDTLVLINPDNPSGNYIRKKDVLKLAAWTKEEGILFIVDESFIDFMGLEENGTLLDNEILEEYDHLIVVKSISKSYGVPGVRLGVLASSNKDLIAEIKSAVSIWNINSFGEFYMQIVDKYKKDFAKAMAKFQDVRKQYIEDLKAISYLKVYDKTEANYVMCEVTSDYTSRELCEILLDEENVFIKDLSPKLGFEGEFIRVAVKNEEENEKLLNALRRLEGRS